MKIWKWARKNWQQILFYTVSIGGLFVLSFYNLESITSSKLSLPELTFLQNSTSLSGILANPLFAPLKLLEYIVIQLGSNSIYLFRAVPALFGVITVIIFYKLARYWFSPLLAWVGSALMSLSVLYLQHSRIVLPDILFSLSLIALLWTAWLTHRTKHPNLSLVLFFLSVAFSFYIPGMVWFTLLALVIQRHHLIKGLKKIQLPYIVAGILIMLLVITPLLRSLLLNPELVKQWLAIPAVIDIKQIALNALYVPLSLTVQSQANPIVNLGRLPYIDLLTLGLAALGSYAFVLRFNLLRTRILVVGTLISWLLISLGETSIILLMPIIYLLATGGLMFLLQQWYSVFPKNPIARTAGLVLLISLVSISGLYNITRYFVAWQHNPDTAATFQETVPPNLVQ